MPRTPLPPSEAQKRRQASAEALREAIQRSGLTRREFAAAMRVPSTLDAVKQVLAGRTIPRADWLDAAHAVAQRAERARRIVAG